MVARRTYFFFSSRRRHTRWPRDWSSDVCSSDLATSKVKSRPCAHCWTRAAARTSKWHESRGRNRGLMMAQQRSEERRVGKEWRARRWTDGGKKKERGGR